MKFIYYINNIILGLTLLGYTTIIGGLYMQLLLGSIQVIFFFLVLFDFSEYTKNIQKHLLIYALLTGAFLLFFFTSIDLFDDNWVLAILPPMLIAIYFSYILHQLNQKAL